jgi:hypothetical protein
MTPPLHDRLEVCARSLSGQPCKGVMFRPTPELPYCPRCGSNEAGVVYVREGAE